MTATGAGPRPRSPRSTDRETDLDGVERAKDQAADAQPDLQRDVGRAELQRRFQKRDGQHHAEPDEDDRDLRRRRWIHVVDLPRQITVRLPFSSAGEPDIERYRPCSLDAPRTAGRYLASGRVGHPLPMTVDALLQSVPPLAVYGMVGAVVGLESLGIPLPGEIVLVSAALLSSRHELAVNPVGVGVAAVIGAVIGDSTGYAIGRRLGLPLFDRLGRRFPDHFGPGHVRYAERLFERWGARAVFFGRFIALLRIFAGPLAGALKMRLCPVSARKRLRRAVLGRRHHSAGVLRGHGRRAVADAVLLGRAGRCRGVRGDRRNSAARAHIPRDSRS